MFSETISGHCSQIEVVCMVHT